MSQTREARRASALAILVVGACLVGRDACAQEREPDPQIPTVRSLFTNVASDARHLATWGNLEILGGGGALAALIKPYDARLAHDVIRYDDAETVLDAGASADGFVETGGALLTYMIGRAKRAPRLSLTGAELFRAQILSGALTQSLKFAVDRRRPDGGRYSFPSGHTSSAFAAATVIAHEYGTKAGIAAYAGAAYVGLSRLSENRHFASDVAFGAAIGLVSARAVTLGHRRIHVDVAPYANARAKGVQFTLVRYPIS
jgi:membrane-associated phospholipid phosphatase